MKQTLQWFKDREMDKVIMTTPRKDVLPSKEVEASIDTPKEAKYYYELQEKGFTFKVKVRIHRAPPQSCESCEG